MKVVTRSSKKVIDVIPEVVPVDTIVRLSNDDDSITVTYSVKFKKTDLAGGADVEWTGACWEGLKSMRNLDDVIVLRPGNHLEEAFKSFGKTTTDTVNTCIKAEALTQAMLSPAYKAALNQN